MNNLTNNWKLGWNHQLIVLACMFERCELVTSQTSFVHALDGILRLCYLWTLDGQNIHSMIDSGPLRVHRTIDWAPNSACFTTHHSSVANLWHEFATRRIFDSWNVLTTIWSFSMFWFGSCWLTQPLGNICWLPGSRVGWVLVRLSAAFAKLRRLVNAGFQPLMEEQKHGILNISL